jgi:predicted unusual protein kinase regulating ubiquinone biosynthesis (AarF/ABC1/UbiB family)
VVFDMPAIVEHLSTSLRQELDFRREAANIKRMKEVLAPFPRLDVPAVYEEYSTARLLVMQEVQGVPLQKAPPGPARQLLKSHYYQVMVAGFFHADPHPGSMKWWNDKIYLLDLGMAGEVDAEVRELLMLLIMLAFLQRDGALLSEIILMLASSNQPADAIDFAAFQEDQEQLIARYRDLSLKEIRLGPMLQEVTESSARHNAPVPASLTLTGKAFAQMQSAASELDPTLDPFSVAESFVMRTTLKKLAGELDPKKIFYMKQKAWVRALRLLEGIEGLVGARPGGSLPMHIQDTQRLEETIVQASK